MLDKNEAPEGYEAAEGTGESSHDCQKCYFHDDGSGVCIKDSVINCFSAYRKDNTTVFFIPKKPEPKSYECWAYIGAGGRICADSDFAGEEDTWLCMLGGSDRNIEAAKARGARVVKVKITEIAV